MLTRLATQPLENIIFSDEKLFTIEEATNKQNDRILAPTSSSITEKHLYVKRTQKPQSVMVWAGISAKGRTPLVFVPVGVKINSSTYQKLILEPVVKDLSKTMFNKESFLFQQDGAPAHTSNISQNWLRENSGFHYQGGMASIKPRFESDGLLNLVHIGEKCLCKVTFKCGSSEEVIAP